MLYYSIYTIVYIYILLGSVVMYFYEGKLFSPLISLIKVGQDVDYHVGSWILKL